MGNILNPLIKWGEKFRGFLAFAAFVLVILLAAALYLFKQGSFDQLLSNFGKLNGGQFFIIVLSVLGILFILVMLLIILGYRSTRPPQKEEPQKDFYVRVSDAKTKQRLADARVLMTPQGDRTWLEQTDWKGEARFAFPAAYKGRKCGVEASREDYENASVQVELGKQSDVQLNLPPKDHSQSSEALQRASQVGNTKPPSSDTSEHSEINNSASNYEAQGRPGTFLQNITMSRKQSASIQQDNRRAMLSRVEKKWITDYLEASLRPATNPIWPKLGKESNTASQMRSQPLDFYPHGTTIEHVYEKADGRLLILGEPGSGKTILLLALARTLLKDAMLHDTYPMPVVFKLSSWAAWVMEQEKEQPTLEGWLIHELKTKYEIPEEIGRPWIKDRKVLPLLDGLDEMDSNQQLACRRAINAYLQTYGKGIPLVVSCRSEDYFRHKVERINLQKAVTVQPLEPNQIDEYLSCTGEHLENLETVRQALHDYESVRKLAENPLMLSVITQFYDKVPIEDLAALSSQAQQQQIFETYVNNRFSPPGGILPLYGQSQTKQWLAWLANQLQLPHHSQTEFYIERMQPDWLPERSRLLYRLIVSLVGGLVGAVLFWQLSQFFLFYFDDLPLVVQGAFVVLGGLLGYLIVFFGSAVIKPAETLSWSWVNVWRNLPESLVIGLVGAFFLGLINWLFSSLFPEPPYLIFQIGFYGLFGLLGIVVYALVGWLTGLVYEFSSLKLRNHNLIVTFKDLQDSAWTGVLIGLVVGLSEFIIYALYDRLIDRLIGGPKHSTDLAYDLFYGFVSGLASSLLGGLIFGLSQVLSGKKLEERKLSAPNQGIWRSARNSVFVGLLIGLFVGLVVELLFIQEGYDLGFGPTPGLLIGLAGGLVSGLSNGGFACIQHFFLRLFLRYAGSIPLKYTDFLDYASDLKLLRKVGGGYVFLHSLLQEYFASLYSTPVSDVAAQQEQPAL